jgi:hypothetical protein
MTKSLERVIAALERRRAAAERELALAPLREALDAMLGGNVDAGKGFLRDYIKATVGFEQLGAATGIPPKSLIRMFGPRGNPQARNLFKVIWHLQQRAKVSFHVAP